MTSISQFRSLRETRGGSVAIGDVVEEAANEIAGMILAQGVARAKAAATPEVATPEQD